MDTMLGYNVISSMITGKYRSFKDSFCYFPLVMDGANGSETIEFLCEKSSGKMSIYNTFGIFMFGNRWGLSAFLS